ncbi:DUF6332 family protein [Streptomyces graminofaciens]|jgi:hypothetical protein|nr:DUF6332 family protein [Streptomyces graminofaciens]
MTNNGGTPHVSGGRNRRTKADQDAMTVEIGYAFFSAAFAAALLFGVLAGPALLFALPGLAERLLVHLGGYAAAVLFVVRFVAVMIRFAKSAQPSQPGRTNPDS